MVSSTGASSGAASAELHQGGATLCMVPHDATLAARAQRIVRMLDGRVQAELGQAA